MARDVLPARRAPAKLPLIAILLLFLPGFASAWGERGHRVICEVAVRLVREEGLAVLLRNRGPMMGHLCNIPDILWRGSRKSSREADASHFINADLFRTPVGSLPLEFVAFRALARKEGIAPERETGSLWWRADQFFRMAVLDGKKAKASGLDSDIFGLIVDLGLLGHFVGDGAMPYHSTADYDGWEKGRGGIHGYYETLLVDDHPLDLPMTVFRQAETMKRPVATVPVVGRMRELSEASLKDIAELEKRDDKAILQRSQRAPGADRRKDKRAERLPAFRAVEIFGDLPSRHLARGASFLAELWDRAYVEAGRPDLSRYRSRRYPLTPKFVRPDYTEGAE